jgi:tRNA-guanine transglycosylase
MVTVEEDRVLFTSHVDGSRHEFTPEVSIRVQRALGADVILAFDECTSPLHDEAYTAASSERTHRWAERSLRAFHEEPAVHDHPQRLYGIVQGGAFPALRRRSAEVIGSMDFGGVAIGGNLGETRAAMLGVLDVTVPHLPAALPRHLLGMGDVPSIFEGVARGIDTFDCVAPTRNARNGGLLARFDDDGAPLPGFRRNLRNARYADDLRPIDETCDCSTCLTHSRAFVRHLLKAGEPLGAQLATIHNLRFMSRLMEEIGAAVREDRFSHLMEEWLSPEVEASRRSRTGAEA